MLLHYHFKELTISGGGVVEQGGVVIIFFKIFF